MKFLTNFVLLFLLGNCSFLEKEHCSYAIDTKDLPAFKSTFKSQQKPSGTGVFGKLDLCPIENYIDRISKNKTFSVYNCTHNLLVPLVYAYDRKNIVLQNTLARFFQQCNLDSILTNSGQLDQLHFCYLVAEYLRYSSLSPESNEDLKATDDIFSLEKEYLLRIWTEDKGNVWDDEACFFVGKRSRIAYIIKYPVSQTSKKYYHTITDFELFTMSIGASLACYELNRCGAVSDELAEIAYYYIVTLRSQIKFYHDGGWLLQPGEWSDYRDFLYAGNSTIAESLSVKQVQNISWDASHFSRMPGFLNTLSALFSSASDNGKFIAKLKKGLANQFVNKVAVALPDLKGHFQFNNFMDGSNGVFRYRYTPSSLGYGPYSNSAHMLYGWWGLLDDKRIRNIYSNIYLNFDDYIKSDGFRLADRNIPNLNDYFKTIVYLSSQLDL